MASRRRPLSREEQIIRKREKEYQHQKIWNDQQKYYELWDNTNSKYEEWTSPRYYDANTQLIKQMQLEKAMQENKERRREKLRKLFEDERSCWEVELMQRKEEEIRSPRNPRERPGDIPTEILKQVHEGIKEREEEKKRKEAELRLYHQWRSNNTFLRDYESACRSKDLKTSWLHQQMEKRKRKEKELEEEKKLQFERDERLKGQFEQEEIRRKENERRNKELKEIIDKQVEEIKQRQIISEKLKMKEKEERDRKIEMDMLSEKQKIIDEMAKQREIALFNIRQYKIKLKQKFKNIQDNLAEQEGLMKRLRDTELAEHIEDEKLRGHIKEAVEGFLKVSREQKRLEEMREKHLQFLFDSEAQVMYERQSEIWKKEQEARQQLIDDVLRTVSEQIENNYRKRREEQEGVIKEREVLIKMSEDYNKELKELQEDEREKQVKRKRELDKQVKEKHEAKKAIEDGDKLKQITEELKRAKIEEERLKREIMHLHRGQGLCKPSSKNNIVF